MILAKIWILLFFTLTISIILMEARLYAVGTTVFGLFSLATLFAGKNFVDSFFFVMCWAVF